MKEISNPPQEPEFSASADAADLIDEHAAEEDDELEIPEMEKELPSREPELTAPELDELTTWDEPAGQYGERVEPIGLEDESLADEELAEEGLDTAEDELRDQEELDEELLEEEEEIADSRADEA